MASHFQFHTKPALRHDQMLDMVCASGWAALIVKVFNVRKL